MPVIEKLSTKSTMDSSRTTSKLTKYEDPSVVSKFLSAGLAASFAEAVTIPIDTAKVRLQVILRNLLVIVNTVCTFQGFAKHMFEDQILTLRGPNSVFIASLTAH